MIVGEQVQEELTSFKAQQRFESSFICADSAEKGRKVKKPCIGKSCQGINENLHIEHICNSGIALWNSGEEGKERRMIEPQ
jgi:hypothetical protein